MKRFKEGILQQPGDIPGIQQPSLWADSGMDLVAFSFAGTDDKFLQEFPDAIEGLQESRLISQFQNPPVTERKSPE